MKSFTNPATALAEFEASTNRPQMIVTDYCMDNMNGLDLISEIRRSAPDIKSIVISGVIDQRDITSQLEMNRDRFIQKPFRVSNLIETLNSSLAEVHN